MAEGSIVFSPHGRVSSLIVAFRAGQQPFPPSLLSSLAQQVASRIQAGAETELVLGDLDVMRDWGFAGDYVVGMWRMLQVEEPRDFVIGTGVPHTVRDLCRIAFEVVGLHCLGLLTQVLPVSHSLGPKSNDDLASLGPVHPRPEVAVPFDDGLDL